MAAEVRRPGAGECRALSATAVGGHAAVYNVPSVNLGRFVEVLEEGCFDGSLAEGGNVVARFNHQHVFASTNDGNLSLRTDSTGLLYLIDPAPGWLLEMVGSGECTSSSFAFDIRAGGSDRWGLTDSGSLVREVADVGRLVDVAPLSIDPAYPAASDVALRGLDAGLAYRILLERKAAW